MTVQSRCLVMNLALSESKPGCGKLLPSSRLLSPCKSLIQAMHGVVMIPKALSGAVLESALDNKCLCMIYGNLARTLMILLLLVLDITLA